jgi:hypothetical protein
MTLPTLATIDDYVARHGSGDLDRLPQLLEDASSFIRQEAGQTISLVEDDIVVLEGQCSRSLTLPQWPVVAVSSVEVDDAVADTSTYRLDGGLLVRRLGHGVWPRCEIEVTYDHGYAEIPAWIVSMVCSTVQRALRPTSALGIQQQTTGSQSVSYASSAAGVNLWLTRDEAARLRAIGPPMVA